MGVFFGLAFLAKQFQGLVPVPAIGMALLLLGSGTLRQRIGRLGSSAVAMVLAGGWWVAVVELTPTGARPYVGGSLTNSIVELTLDYNGVARLLRFPISENGSPATGDADLAPYDGGFSRLFNGNFAPECAWLLATGLAAVVMLAVYGRKLRGRLQRAIAVAASVWFISAWLLISFMGTMVHSYYSYSLVAPLALVVSLGLRVAWLRSDALVGRLFGIFLLGTSAFMGFRIMQYSDAWGWWGPVLLVALNAIACTLWLVRRRRQWNGIFWAFVLAALSAGQVGTDVFTFMNPIQGTQPLSGPVSNDPNAMSRHLQEIRTTGQPDWAPDVAYGVAPSQRLLQIFASEGNGRGRWLAATYPAQDAALTQLTTSRATISLGGWLGLDPAPTLDQFKAWVAKGDIEFFVDHPAMHSYGLGQQAESIANWVKANYHGEAVDNAVVYRLDNAHAK
jgi:4-amino-4-deoxy-L-arabinose transferase-like glycosyltransferase